MSRFFGSLMGMAAGFAFISAALHVLAYLASGFDGALAPLLAFAVIWAVVGWTLLRGWRWMAYLGFLLALFGAVAAYVGMGGQGFPVREIQAAISLADLGVAVTLFLAIWRR